MSFYPDKSHLMRLLCFQQAFPEICIFNRFIFASFPAFFQPAVNPVLIKGIGQIFGVRIKLHFARSGQLFQTGDRCHQLHAVVGRPYISLAVFPLMQHTFAVDILQDRSVTARSVRVSSCCTICKNFYKHLFLLLKYFSKIRSQKAANPRDGGFLFIDLGYQESILSQSSYILFSKDHK